MHIRDRLLARIAGMKLWPPAYQEAIGFLQEDAKTFARMYDKLVDGAVKCEEKVQDLKARLVEVELERTALLPCGHFQWNNDSYGGCVACKLHETLKAQEEEIEELRMRLADLTEAARPFAPSCHPNWPDGDHVGMHVWDVTVPVPTVGDVRRLRDALAQGEGR